MYILLTFTPHIGNGRLIITRDFATVDRDYLVNQVLPRLMDDIDISEVLEFVDEHGYVDLVSARYDETFVIVPTGRK